MGAKVSVVVAVYNAAQYIEVCVRSLFGQTLGDMEFIFVDDKSDDGSIDIVRNVLKDYLDREEQVKMLFHEENQGVAATKNDGIKSATGEYLIIVDPDDYVELDMMEQMSVKAEVENADVVICDYYRDGDGDTEKHSIVEDESSIKEDLLNRRNHAFCVLRLFRRDLFFQDETVWPVGQYAEDIVYSTVTSFYSQKIVHVDKPFYHYRIHDSSLAHAFDEEKCLKRYYGSVENASIVSDFLQRVDKNDVYWKGVLVHKIRARNQLLPVINKKNYRRLWFKTFPEINKMLFWGDKHYHATYREKVWYIAIALGLYPRYKKYLGGKHLRPFPQWPVW